MAKKVQGVSGRKPPEPTDDHEQIREWLGKIMPDLQPVAERLDELIRKEHPDAQYAIKWKKAYYGLPEQGWIIELVAYDVSMNAVFHGGADFDSPPPLGDTGRSRYVKVHSVEEVDTAEMRAWIEEAGKTAGWK